VCNLSHVVESARQGPAMLRGDFIPKTTTDQRLLDRARTQRLGAYRPLAGDADPGRVRGGFRPAPPRLGPAVVRSSARRGPGQVAANTGWAERIGAGLAEAGYAVITGGGPGVMEAANKGRPLTWGGISVGLGIELPMEMGPERLRSRSGWSSATFFVRKTVFIKYSQAFVVLPGGFGTLDELFEALTLVQTGKITKFPIVLVGSWYWSGLLSWIRDTVLASGKHLARGPGAGHGRG